MRRGYLALVLELHHRLPGPGEAVESAWGATAAETYWPILRELTRSADAGSAEVATVAVSPSWIALAADPIAQARTRAELDLRADRERGGRDSEYWHALRRFAVDRFGDDLLTALRRAAESGAVEVIPLTAGHAWLPSVADSPIVARASRRGLGGSRSSDRHPVTRNLVPSSVVSTRFRERDRRVRRTLFRRDERGVSSRDRAAGSGRFRPVDYSRGGRGVWGGAERNHAGDRSRPPLFSRPAIRRSGDSLPSRRGSRRPFRPIFARLGRSRRPSASRGRIAGAADRRRTPLGP